MIPIVGHKVQWHMIGHLQWNKVKKALLLFDMVETLDSWRLAVALDRQCAEVGKIMPVLAEINSGREARKTGVLPEKIDEFVQQLSTQSSIQVQGFMTMRPRFGNPEDARAYFHATHAAFERLAALNLPNICMHALHGDEQQLADRY